MFLGGLVPDSHVVRGGLLKDDRSASPCESFGNQTVGDKTGETGVRMDIVRRFDVCARRGD
jgi:hypothetical protein